MKRLVALIFLACITWPAMAAWEYEEEADEMGRGSIKAAIVTSTNSFQLDFPYSGEQYARVLIRRHPKHGNDVIFSIARGHLICEYDDCAVTVRFDNNKPVRFSATKPSDHSTTAFFLGGFNRFVSSAKNAKRMQIEVVFYRQGSRIFNFDITGLKWR